ncbi:hypothetical protein [Lutibacter flavus]|uniref:Uncharacterized protein n=1 Tax=Lutibacter flavus TaxID=691689 RepID=A0A238VEQ1_9FLAO|nr:hypothetical protein [Lutibacter flavus]SNR32880.1 hypothetical protein SAMN04488111_0382 [Lutibacter flavus]
MKQLTKIAYLLLITVFITSCEKQTDDLPENSEMFKEETKVPDLNELNSVGDAIIAGVDIQTYFNSLPKREILSNRPSFSQIPIYSGLNFFFDSEDFHCNDLPTESFDQTINNTYPFDGYGNNILDENTDTYFISPGYILPGISFESGYDEYWGLYIWTDSYYNQDKALFENGYEDLIIKFTNNNVTSVSMDISSWNWYTYVSMDVYGDSGYLGTSTINIPSTYDGQFWGVTSAESITKIVLYDSYYGGGFVGIDNISFGNCEDIDGDGCLNEDDAHPNSNISEFLSIGEYSTDIENNLVDCGTTMADQIDDLLEEINEAYNGDNWEELHRKFTRELSKITYGWRKDRLITRSERSQISSWAYGSDIPSYYDID